MAHRFGPDNTMKKSLIITDEDKYGPATTPSPGIEGAKSKPRRMAPTVTLTGKQVDAFCGCSLKPGDKGTATFHYVVKAASAGEEYGDTLPEKGKGNKKLTLAITHVERDEKDGDDEEAGEDPAEEKGESAEEEAGEESAEPASGVEAPLMDKVSPGDAGFDDE